MTNPYSFAPGLIGAFEAAKIIGVRSGVAHRFTGVWVVVVRGRVFARSWTDAPSGWYRAFLAEPLGAIELTSGRRVRVAAKRVRGERLLDAIDDAYAEKYHTPASLKWVRGFKRRRRRATTIEFVRLTPLARTR